MDVAYGSLNRYLALGKIPTNANSGATEIVTYAGSVGTSPSEVKLRTMLPGSTAVTRTHTEPRLSFNDQSCTYLGAWPNRQGEVVLASFALDGNLIDTTILDGTVSSADSRALTPVEVNCPSHSVSYFPLNHPPSSSKCKIYYQDSDTVALAYRQGKIVSRTVTISHGGTYPGTCSMSGNKGNIGAIGAWTSSTTTDDVMIIDATTWAKNVNSPVFLDQGSFITTDRKVTSANGTSPIRARLDRDGTFQNVLTSSTWSMNNSGDLGMTNLTSWDWNETREMMVAVRLGDYQ